MLNDIRVEFRLRVHPLLNTIEVNFTNDGTLPWFEKFEKTMRGVCGITQSPTGWITPSYHEFVIHRTGMPYQPIGNLFEQIINAIGQYVNSKGFDYKIEYQDDDVVFIISGVYDSKEILDIQV